MRANSSLLAQKHMINMSQMTGLDVDNDVIIEIFCIITNGQMEVLDEEGWGCVVHASREKMDGMSDYVKKMHQRSGLTSKVLQSTTTAEEAADELLAYIQRFVPERKVALLAGSSVHADKAFLRKEPYRKVNSYLHHRILDVSTIKEAAKRWSPKDIVRRVPQKQGLHEARADILESIAEAKYYKDVIFGVQKKED